MSELILPVGLAHKLETAFNRNGWTLADVDKACEGDRLGQFRQVLLGYATITAAEKFALLVDLGTITVPKDYEHTTHLASFAEKNRKKFYYYNENIIDANFPNPSRVLKPGDKFRVRAFKQIVPGTTTSEERMAFLAKEKAVHTGAQGASLVFEQKQAELPKGYWYCSFDERKRLWKGADGYHRVPVVGADSDGDFYFDLGYFEPAWDDDYALLCFCDAE